MSGAMVDPPSVSYIRDTVVWARYKPYRFIFIGAMNLRWLLQTCFGLLLFPLSNHIHALTPLLEKTGRRKLLERILFSEGIGIGSSFLFHGASPVHAAGDESSSTSSLSPNGLASRLLQRDPTQLQNRIFNSLPPSVQVYPDWISGDWMVTSRFSGYLFPSSKIPRDKLALDFAVPGFQKCSIAATADVGKESVNYIWRVDPASRQEDRADNFRTMINAYLGYSAIKEVLYDAKANPNRISIDFVDYRTVNAERIELFCNARESAPVYMDNNNAPVFCCSEYIRQVTFGTGSAVGVPRQAVSNYANFWTWKKVDDQNLQGNLLTAGYLDPNDALYFGEPTLPVVVYSHSLVAKRRALTEARSMSA